MDAKAEYLLTCLAYTLGKLLRAYSPSAVRSAEVAEVKGLSSGRLSLQSLTASCLIKCLNRCADHSRIEHTVQGALAADRFIRPAALRDRRTRGHG